MSGTIAPIGETPAATQHSNGMTNEQMPLSAELTTTFVALGRLLQHHYPDQYAQAQEQLGYQPQLSGNNDPWLVFAEQGKDDPMKEQIHREIMEARRAFNETIPEGNE